MSQTASLVRRWLWLPLLAISLGMIGWGLQAGEFSTVRGWFNQLCAACIGLSGR